MADLEQQQHETFEDESDGTLTPLALSRTVTKASDGEANDLILCETALQRRQRREQQGKPKKKVFFDGSSRDNEHDYDVAHKDPNSPYNPHIFMTVPIRLPDPSPPSTPVPKQKQKNNPRAWLSRTFSKEKKTSDLHVVQMTRAEYLKYWARDANGKYIGTAPEGEGIEIWRNKLGVNRRDSAAPPTSETSDFAISRPELPLRSLST